VALPATATVPTRTDGASASLDVSGLWSPNFPPADLVSAAAGLFAGHRVEDRTLGVTLLGVEPCGDTASERKTVELFGDPRGDQRRDRLMVEGPRWRVMVSPGTVAIRYQDPARVERAAQRAAEVEWKAFRALREVGQPLVVERETGGAVISRWSKRSRSRMAEVFAQLDWSVMFTDETAVPAMVTLTYPGDWLAVAPLAAESRRHLLMLRKRFARAWGRPLVGVWKREFQRRGAPHYHLLMVPPHGQVNGQGFAAWLSSTWAAIVGAERCTGSEPCSPVERCEFHRHLAAGTGVDYADGIRARDPRSVGVYFAKHGAFAEKEYQNEAPAEWIEAGSVGRFWGVWGLDKAVSGAFIAPPEARAAVRTLRRHSRANAYTTRVPVWRYRTVVDPETGEVTARWRKSTAKRRVYRMKGEAGFVVTKDGPALASALARHLDRLHRPESVIGRSGAGPIGYLP
jgi:hypothetical protein